MLFRQLFDEATWTYTYLIADPVTKEAALIDAVSEQVDRDMTLINELGLNLKYILDTHAHADHITGAHGLRKKSGARVVLAKESHAKGVDVEVVHGDELRLGDMVLEVRATPGHTNGCLTYVAYENEAKEKPLFAVVGDSILIRGTGRTDFQQGSSETLFKSIHEQIFTLPDDTPLYVGHDYKGRMVTTVGEEKAHNPRVGKGKTVEEYVVIMKNLNLALPRKLAEALPKNMRSGQWAPILEGELPEVDVDWALKKEEGIQFVDVRSEDEFVGDLGHLAHCENVPLETLKDVAAQWNPRRPVVLVCRSGKRSLVAVQTLQELGFDKVASLRGGMLAVKEVQAAA
ncbi:MAG: MBL fold metallo-hydrolase [Deltaproteobacteria bacterium]|nr:MBL fold metallo-hydrolase [Deltaproteobacteria bacterium]